MLPRSASRFRLPATRAFSSTARRGIAKVTVVGRLAGDPEFNTASSGTEYARYTVASSFRRKSGEEHTSWFRVTAFPASEKSKGYLAAIKKGCLVYVEGDVTLDVYEGDDGRKSRDVSIIQRNINVLSRRGPKTEGEEES